MTRINLSRRQFGTLASVSAIAAMLRSQVEAADKAAGGKVRHSVCKWCYKEIPLEDFCLAAKEIGLESVELLNPADFATVKKHGLHCAMVSYPTIEGPGGVKLGPIPKGWNRVEHHDLLVQAYEPLLQTSAEAGFKQVICFSGNRDGMSDEQGLENCAKGLARLMPLCEKLGVTLVMELLNSKVNHPDYMCDHSAWGVALCKKIGSPHFKLLYDIYHMQIMEGDVIATIRRDHKYFAHYHTGGVPGRAEIDETQELNYPAIIKAIQETGYTGFLGQEFIPKRADKIASLKQGCRFVRWRETPSSFQRPVNDLNSRPIHAMHGSMQKIQILFPDPLMKMLRNLARVEDRPVSEIVRRAVDRDLEQRAGMLKRSKAGGRAPAFPTFGGGKVLAKASEMKALIYGDEMP